MKQSSNTQTTAGDTSVSVADHAGMESTDPSFNLHSSVNTFTDEIDSDNICICQHPPLEPPGFEMLFVLFDHAVALEAATVTQPLHNLHQPDLAVNEKIDAWIES